VADCRSVVSNLFSLPNFCADVWAEVLLLADKYLMDDIYAGSIKQLKHCDPPLNAVEMIRVALKVNAQDLYRQAVNEIADSDEILSREDARKIGHEALYDVYALQMGRKDDSLAHAHKRARVSKSVFESPTLDDLFGIE
jgi:hypothetical protein